MLAPRPGSAQLQSELGPVSQRWTRWKLFGEEEKQVLSLPEVRSLAFARGGVQNFKL